MCIDLNASFILMGENCSYAKPKSVCLRLPITVLSFAERGRDVFFISPLCVNVNPQFTGETGKAGRAGLKSPYYIQSSLVFAIESISAHQKYFMHEAGIMKPCARL